MVAPENSNGVSHLMQRSAVGELLEWQCGHSIMSVWRCLRTTRIEGKSSDLINQEGWNQPRNPRGNAGGSPHRNATGSPQINAHLMRIVQTSSTHMLPIPPRREVLRAVLWRGRVCRIRVVDVLQPFGPRFRAGLRRIIS